MKLLRIFLAVWATTSVMGLPVIMLVIISNVAWDFGLRDIWRWALK